MVVRWRGKRLVLQGLPGRLTLAAGVVSLVLLLSTGLVRWRGGDGGSQPSTAARPALALEQPGFEDSPDGPAALEWEEYAAFEPTSSGSADPLPPRAEPWPEADARPGSAEAGPSTLDCIIEPFQVVAIGSPVTGLIEKVHVERSDLVEAGQILVELESTVERAAVALARSRSRMNGELEARQANHALGQRNRERAEKLFENNALSLELRETVETEAEVARLEVEQARDDKRLASLQLEQALAVLKRRTIHSPISGVVTERLMSAGERVEEETILKVARVDALRVEVILPAAMFGSIRPGMRASVVPEFPGDQVHVASVTIVDRVIDAASGTFGARLELPNLDQSIPGGLHCQVRFLTE
jgi:RND family efflux transporter MFP subunit